MARQSIVRTFWDDDARQWLRSQLAGRNIESVARETGIDARTIRGWGQANRPAPSAENLITVVRALQFPVQTIDDVRRCIRGETLSDEQWPLPLVRARRAFHARQHRSAPIAASRFRRTLLRVLCAILAAGAPAKSAASPAMIRGLAPSDWVDAIRALQPPAAQSSIPAIRMLANGLLAPSLELANHMQVDSPITVLDALRRLCDLDAFPPAQLGAIFDRVMFALPGLSTIELHYVVPNGDQTSHAFRLHGFLPTPVATVLDFIACEKPTLAVVANSRVFPLPPFVQFIDGEWFDLVAVDETGLTFHDDHTDRTLILAPLPAQIPAKPARRDVSHTCFPARSAVLPADVIGDVLPGNIAGQIADVLGHSESDPTAAIALAQHTAARILALANDGFGVHPPRSIEFQRLLGHAQCLPTIVRVAADLICRAHTLSSINRADQAAIATWALIWLAAWHSGAISVCWPLAPRTLRQILLPATQPFNEDRTTLDPKRPHHLAAGGDSKPTPIRIAERKSIGVEIARLGPTEAIERIRVNLPATVGRVSESSIQVRTMYVSRQHARITASADSLMLTNLSTNGITAINGRMVVPGTTHPLAVGDIVTIDSDSLMVANLGPSPNAP